MSKIAETVVANDKAVWEAAKRKDVTRFNELVADDARMVFESGILTKSEYLEALSNRTITDYTLSDYTVVQPADNLVILIYKASISGIYKGKPFPAGYVRESSVWVKRQGKWVAVLNQETAIAR